MSEQFVMARAPAHRAMKTMAGYLIRVLVRFPGLLPFVSGIVPNAVSDSAIGRSFWVAAGYKLFQEDKPRAAWLCLEHAVRGGKASTEEYLLAAMCLFHGLGRFAEAKALLGAANARREEQRKLLGLTDVTVRLLDGVWARHIGHCAQIDYVIKMGLLEGRPKAGTMLYVPPGAKVANRFLLRLLSEHIQVVEHPGDLPFPESAVEALHYDLLGPRLPDGSTRYIWEAAGQVYETWQREGRGPLLRLPDETAERGRETLRAAGISRDSWFVALHVREGKWDGQKGGLHGVLNADIETYFDAIEEITGRGGWVIRLGDTGMRPLPPMPNVLDYCHSEVQSDWMDIFIMSQCRFMIGTSSGPAYVPTLFGVPAVLTNWWPPGAPPWQNSDIFVPKMLRRLRDTRYLTLSETLGEPASYCHSRSYLAEEDLQIEDNDPALIRSAVREMFERLEGRQGGPEISGLRAKADAIYRAHGIVSVGDLSAGYLKRYGGLIA